MRIALFLAASLVILLIVAACGRSTAHAPDAPELASDEPRTYAWAEAVSPLAVDGSLLDDDQQLHEFRAALDDRFEKAGYRRTDLADAGLIASVQLGTAVRTRELDPEWSFYRVERLEEGTVALSLESAATGQLLWSNLQEVTLRVIDRGFGATTTQWTGTDETRDWKVGRTAAKLVRGLP